MASNSRVERTCSTQFRQPSDSRARSVWPEGVWMADQFLYFTELMGMPVLDVRGRRIGRVKDAALVPLVNPSRIDRYLVGGGESWLTVRYAQVQSVELGRGIH